MPVVSVIAQRTTLGSFKTHNKKTTFTAPERMASNLKTLKVKLQKNICMNRGFCNRIFM